jgi:hypothetical protein
VSALWYAGCELVERVMSWRGVAGQPGLMAFGSQGPSVKS